MDAGQIVTAACLLVGGGLYVWLVRAARHRTLTRRTLIALSAISGGLLLAMVISDWPFQQMNSFWAEHSILGAVLSTLLLASVGYLAFEAGESARQSELDRSVTIVGMSGLVDRLVDVEIALGLLAAPRRPDKMTETTRPLEWLRDSRAAYLAAGEPAEMPPPEYPADRPNEDAEWQMRLIDQCVRRVIGGMRDWAALVGLSEDGRQVLRRFGDVRLDLLTLQRHVRDAPEQPPNTLGLRRYLRIFAVALESVSSAGNPRDEVQHYNRSSDRFLSLRSTLDGVSSSAELRRAFTILDGQHTDLVLNSDCPGNQVRIAKPDAESR